MALTAATVSAEEAKTLGLVSKVVPHDQLMTEVDKICDILKGGAPVAQAMIKRILNRKCHEDWDYTLGIMPTIFATEDMAEAKKAFMEKRKPVFRGK